MTETFIRFSLFIGIVLLFAIVSILAQKFPIIGAFLSLLQKLLIFLLLILLGGFLIFAHSFLACIIIGLAAFFVPESHYLYAGEPINPLLDEHHTALFKLSVTYGILYLLVYISCILFYSLFRLSDWIHNGLIFITTSFIVVISYPVLIHAIFPDLTVSIKGVIIAVEMSHLCGVLSHRLRRLEPPIAKLRATNGTTALSRRDSEPQRSCLPLTVTPDSLHLVEGVGAPPANV